MGLFDTNTPPFGLSTLYTNNDDKHKVFVSFHHENDQTYKDYFVNYFSLAMNGFISKSVNDGDISPNLTTDTIRSKIRDNFIQDATVLIVLIGTHTWQRRHVDWEISSSIRETLYNKRCGLMGILLPAHSSFRKQTYDGGIVPPRLVQNQACGYACIYDWTEDVSILKKWIHAAYDRRTKIEPTNAYPMFQRNKTSDRWK